MTQDHLLTCKFWLNSPCFSSPLLCSPFLRAHIARGLSAGPGSRNWAAGHESQPGSVLGQITVNDRQSLPRGITEDDGWGGKKEEEEGACIKKVSKNNKGDTQVLRKHRTELQRGLGELWSPENALNVYKFNQEQLWLHLTVLWSYWYLLSTIRLHFLGGGGGVGRGGVLCKIKGLRSGL